MNTDSIIASLANTTTNMMDDYCTPNKGEEEGGGGGGEANNHRLLDGSFLSLGSSSSLLNASDSFSSYGSSSSLNSDTNLSLLLDEEYALLFPENHHDGILRPRRKTHRRSSFSFIGNSSTMEVTMDNNTPTIVPPKSKCQKKTHRRSQYCFMGNDTITMECRMMIHHPKNTK